ncbi:hypothetical protein JCM10213v2_001277 [Rhodosporidiobolus nylandii]
MSGPIDEYVSQSALMSFKPINAIHQHLSGLHCYADNLKAAVPSHHFCACVRHDGDRDSDKADARLVGIEYVVDEDVFAALPEDEKVYWHSHKHEVESGQLNLVSKSFVPNVAEDIAEQGAMKELHRTYGKSTLFILSPLGLSTIHTWAVDRSPTVPLGPPSLMMAFTADGQVDPAIITARDKAEGHSTEHKRQLRAKYLDTSYQPLPGADQPMKTGKGIRFEPVEVDVEVPSPADQATWRGQEKFEDVLSGKHKKAPYQPAAFVSPPSADFTSSIIGRPEHAV